MAKTNFKNVEEYISLFPGNVQAILQELRQTISSSAPEAEEVISYQMPTYKRYRNLVHFAAFKNHIGFYPTPTPIEVFRDELAPYKVGKGSVQFPLDQPLPWPLIRKMVKHRVKEDMEWARKKGKASRA